MAENTTPSINALNSYFEREVENVKEYYLPLLLRLLAKCSHAEITTWIKKGRELMNNNASLLERYIIATSIRERVLNLIQEGCVE